MKAVIFAGGVGTRLWPVSRRKTPKQFEEIIGNKSTLQLAAERLLPEFSWQEIFVSTGAQYKEIVFQQLSKLPSENVILEPEMRDVGPAVGLVTAIFYKISPHTPFVILWSDHLIKNTQLFKKIVLKSEKVLKKERDKIIYIGQKPRFASQNLGWLELGNKRFSLDGINFFDFRGLVYRPNIEKAEKFFKDDRHAWNLGYFITTPEFLWCQFEKFVPEIYKKLKKIQAAWGTKDYQRVLQKNYPTLEKISFDNAILEKLDPETGYVTFADLEWSDVGAWEALKEALQENPEENVVKGKVLTTDCQDSLIYNFTDKMIVAIDVNGFLIINTKDVVLVCNKNSVPKIKKLVESLKGTEYEDLT